MIDCKCKFCQLYDRIRTVKNSWSWGKKNKLIDDLADLYWNTDSDLNREQSIADGSWPTAIEILESRLIKARKVKEKEIPK